VGYSLRSLPPKRIGFNTRQSGKIRASSSFSVVRFSEAGLASDHSILPPAMRSSSRAFLVVFVCGVRWLDASSA